MEIVVNTRITMKQVKIMMTMMMETITATFWITPLLILSCLWVLQICLSPQLEPTITTIHSPNQERRAFICWENPMTQTDNTIKNATTNYPSFGLRIVVISQKLFPIKLRRMQDGDACYGVHK